jgi:sialate O-acetylesterase
MRALAGLALVVAVGTAASRAAADVSLPTLLSDHAVLQRGRPIPVWGRADPGEKVIVTLAGKSASAEAGGDGRWRVVLPALEAGGPFEMTVEGRNRLVVKDLLVGEVWVCSGQSNMSMTVAQSKDAEQEQRDADHPGIRLLTVPLLAATEPQEDFAGAWAACAPATVPRFSAVAYYFGREVHRQAKVPVGLIHCSWGGTVAEAWTPEEKVAAEPALRPLWDRWQKASKEYDPKEAEAKYRKAHEKWRKEAEEDRRAGRKPPPEPPLPPDPRRNRDCPGALFRGMVAPLLPFPVRGVAWYQGESNAARAYQYRNLFPLLIRSWREAFGDPAMPFYFVQIANFAPGGKEAPSGGDSAWAELREAQAMVLRLLTGTGMAVAIDVGEAGNIHPRNKQEVGRRLALWALHEVHGLPLECSGPLYRGMKVEEGRVRIEFGHGDGLRTTDGKEPAGFAVAGTDRKFFPARARMDGDAVVVWLPGISHPAAVRYAWADAPEAVNLVNVAGLPASPFRTDDFPGVTKGKE